MLHLRTLIGRGGSRDCWLHPFNENLCIKVGRTRTAVSEMLREIHTYNHVRAFLPGRVEAVRSRLVETDHGPGLVCQLVRDADGCVSPNLYEYATSHTAPETLQSGLNWIIRRMIVRDLFFFDFNQGNFVVQTRADGSKAVWLVDMKSLNRTGFDGFFKLERVFSPLARTIMFRRARRLYRELGLIFPFDELCRKKFFSNWFVTVRPAS